MEHKPIQKTSNEKRQFWQKHIDEWQLGQLPQQSYCQKANISYSSFTYWRSRLLSESGQKKPRQFIPIKVKPNVASQKNIKIKLRSGSLVYFPSNMSIEELAKLLQLLESPTHA